MMPGLEKVKYFVLNKKEDYECGQSLHMRYENQGMSLQKEAHAGAFLSGLYDSWDIQNEWHRMKLTASGPASVQIKISIYASDDSFIIQNEKETEIGVLLKRPWRKMSLEKKKALFAPYLKKEVQNGEDILLHGVKGRYLWFLAEVYQQGEEPVWLGKIQIFFPKQTWLPYLPQIYDRTSKGDTFLERYLALFQSLYEDMNEEIAEIPSYLDPETAKEDILAWIAGWTGIPDVSLWPAGKLRHLMRHAGKLYKYRGTVFGTAEIIRLYTDSRPFIAEQHKIQNYQDNERKYQLLQSLYGDDPYVFTVLVKEECLPTGKEFSDLKKIIESVKPAWMEARIITLRPYLLLDSYTYLGVNSILGGYKPFTLNGESLIPFSAVGES